MHPVRRRKKRPNYGVRTVEVCRGKNGFGFTISGQQPCILSCIVPNSPADQAGLRAGDYLIAVSGQNVSKTPHDEVVQLIGSCYGILKLQIAENYYSDSSEDDIIAIRQRHKYPHKCKSNGHLSLPVKNGALNQNEDFSLIANPIKVTGQKPPRISFMKNVEVNSGDCIYQCIVGYVGTIEMPKFLTSGSMLQVVKSCIKRLRSEKRNHTPVLMTVFSCSVRLKNENGETLAVYPGGRVTYCGTTSDQSRKHFGILTTSIMEDYSSDSCHVFLTLSPTHSEHIADALRFSITCITDNASGLCKHFPSCSEPIIEAVQKYYNTQPQAQEDIIVNSPHLSNDTSNSDSGIGFKDDSGHQPDRILVVDIQNQRLHIQPAGASDPQCIDCTENTPLSEQKEYDTLQIRRFTDEEHCDGYSAPVPFTGQIRRKSFSSETLLIEKLEKIHDLVNPYYVSQSLEDIKMQNSVYEEVGAVRNGGRKNSLRSVTVGGSVNNVQGDILTRKLSSNSERVEDPKPNMDSRMRSWSSCLENLLYDNYGIHVFAEFLKKEFSGENVYFWVACEKYRKMENEEGRKKMAEIMYEKYLGENATDPVNVDSVCLQMIQQQLKFADSNLFANAQKQIFNLMKFDCYRRFLKNDLYQNLVTREVAGESISLDELKSDPDLSLECASIELEDSNKNSQEDIDKQCRGNRRRRSLMPWSRSRCKSRDQTTPADTPRSSSRASLASWDFTLPPTLCRITLPDDSSAIVNVQPEETVRFAVTKLLEKRSTPYSAFQVVLTSAEKPVNLEESMTILAGKDVKLEWRTEFILNLPDRKSLTVKSKPSHSLGAVIGPVLLRHGYNLQMVTLCLMSENEVLEPTVLVGAIDKQRIQVLTRSTPTPNIQGWNPPLVKQSPVVTLDEITNRVFEQVLHEKSENCKNGNSIKDTAPSVHSEEWGSEHSSGILGKFLRRDSMFPEKQQKSKKIAEVQTMEKKAANKFPPVIAKWKPVAKLDAHFEKVLYEGLKRAQRGRLDDQRGTEINIELPEFLKDKENIPSSRKKLRKVKKTSSAEDIMQVNDAEADDATLYIQNETGTPSKGEPPPLPPKPKNISNTLRIVTNSTIHDDLRSKGIYLDQPTSSFV